MNPFSSWVTVAALVVMVQETCCFILQNASHFESLLKYRSHWRTKRAILQIDKEEVLQLHNKLRGQVYPSASNMEHMEWDKDLERSAESWANECMWEHGPSQLLKSIGQNLAVHWGRYRSPAFHVQAWYDEVKDYTYPYPHECNPWCPEKCSGPMCTHYTQLVWATTNRVGCAVNVCRRMNVWGEIWENAVYLVCNYSPKGNWIGEAPYQHGRPCSECPPSYGGGCRENLCYKGRSNYCTTTQSAVAVTAASNRFSSSFAAQVIKCDTKMRDKCKGTTCNRYLCPVYCKSSKAKVIGTLYYEVQSSICRAAIHYGIIRNEEGGLVDITRKGKIPFFVKSAKYGIQSISKFRPANGFGLSRVTTRTVDCYATVAQLCPFRKPASHCPRINCPPNCMEEFPFWARVIGNNIYSDVSSICRSAVHAGIIKNHIGGLVDVMSVEKKNKYPSVFKNGIQSESMKNPPDGKAFRVFAVA
uniref:Cysteine rich secretory protein LCCL domain containing 2 n=1 Tax=Callorhinchus milii TaxID=7868 RepID=A0A4W3IVU0_CALMI